MAQLNVGDVAPALHAKEWIGEEPTGIRVLAFWATWCGPCVATIPKLNQLASEGINVVGLNEQNIKHIQKFQKRNEDIVDASFFKVQNFLQLPTKYLYRIVGRFRNV